MNSEPDDLATYVRENRDVLANEICTDCRSKYNSKMAGPDLSPTTDGSLVCPDCEGHFNLGGPGE
jgi:hypothetical protein